MLDEHHQGTDFRADFVREPSALKRNPALVLNADFRPLSYYPLSLWPWQEAIKAVFLDRVTIIAAASDTMNAGNWLTSPSPIVRRV